MKRVESSFALKKARSYKTNILVLILLFGVVASFQFYIEVLGYFGFGGLFVSDSISMQSTINSIAQGASIKYRTILGVVVLYYPSYWLGPFYSYFVNAVLLYLSCVFFIKTIPALELNLSRPKIYFIFFVVIANFYILSVMLHPNKEIPLIFLTNAFVYCVAVKEKILLPLVIIFVSATFRDGYGIILLLTLIALNMKIVTYTFYRRPYLILSGFFIFLSFFTIENLIYLNILPDISYVFERNVSYGSQLDSFLNGLPSYLAFPLKLVNNLISAALRPQLFDVNDRAYIVGIGMWQFGVICILGVFSWIYTIRAKRVNINVSKVTLAIFICLLLISSSTFTQPRYLMPYIFWIATGFISILRFHHILILFILLFLSSQIFSLLGLGVLIPKGIDIYPY
jgi:hypothetical protein